MDIPVCSIPDIINELADNYRSCFGEVRQFRHFKEIITALNTTNKRSIAHLNSVILDHVNQSNMNRFLSSRIDTDLMFTKTVEQINSIENDGILVIDDTIVEKTGKNIEAAGWIYDHSSGRTVWGIQFVTTILSGKYGIFPILLQIYQRKEKLEKENKENQYKSKIDLQKSIIEKCISSGLHFSTVIGDAWYFSRDLITFLNRNKLNWGFQCKGNRRIKIEGRWTTLDALYPSYLDSETIRISGNVYTVWEVTGKMKEIGTVKVIISEGIGGRRYYVTNRIDWSIRKILETYLHRWDIEVMHRDLKQDGMGHIFLRKLGKMELYLRLIVTGRVILEISSIKSLERYPEVPEKTEKRKRWVAFELLESILNTFKKYGEHFVTALVNSLMNPYKSTRNILNVEKEIYNGIVI